MRTGTAGLRRCGWLLFSLLLSACAPDGGGEAPAAGQPPAAPAAAPSAADGADPGPKREVVAESLPYAEVGEQLVYGQFVIPADMIDPLPAVLLVHDWWGLNDDMQDLAERLAGAGYIVLAADLFLGRTAETVSAARALEIEAIEKPELVRDNLRQAIDFLQGSAGAPGVAIVGFGFGGGWALKTALARPESLNAAVSFYGPVVTDEEDLAGAEVPFLGFFLENDRAVPVGSVTEFDALMRALSKEADVQVYDRGRRGFVDRSSANYDEALAGLAWQHMLSFLEANAAANR